MTNKTLRERFDERFPSHFTRVDGKDYIEISSFATTPESILAFLESELAQRDREVVEWAREHIRRCKHGEKDFLPDYGDAKCKFGCCIAYEAIVQNDFIEQLLAFLNNRAK